MCIRDSLRRAQELDPARLAVPYAIYDIAKSADDSEAAAERLEKAREVRAAKNPDYGKSGIHESLLNLSDNHPLHPKKVKIWIKTQKQLAAAERSAVKQNVKGAITRQHIHEGYVRHLQRYLKSGDYIDYLHGEYQEKKIRRHCIAIAYDEKGNPKRNVGTYYPDMGCVYTQEMFNLDRGIEDANVQKTKPRRKRNKRAMENKRKKRSNSS